VSETTREWRDGHAGRQLQHGLEQRLPRARTGPEKHRDIYSKLVYHHPYYRDNPHLWKKMGCPVAEAKADEIGRVRGEG